MMENKKNAFLEITGQACSGKTSFLSKKVSIEENFLIYASGNFRKILNFISGLRYLGIFKIKILFKFTLKERGSLYFKMNVFRNAIAKFGIFNHLNKLKKYSKTIVIDEGISHLPFLFLETKTEEVVDFISNELKQIQVIFLISLDRNVIKSRMKYRGHKRLRFLALDDFLDKNNSIEQSLLTKYPDLCSSLIVPEYVEDL